MRIPLGKTIITNGAIDALVASNETAETFLRLHASGDWGNVISADDRALNDRHTTTHGLLSSAYTLSNGTELWVMTAPGWEVTTVLLPEEY